MVEKKIDVFKDIMESNERIAVELKRFYDEKRIFVVNLLSSPGAGKTSLLEKILPELKKKGYNSLVVEGEIETELDTQRIKNLGFSTFQITTYGTCHLEAKMFTQIIPRMENTFHFMFIENIGNLVCPASYYLGEHLRITLLSVPEGEDKPLKYPLIFKNSDLVLISKIDLLIIQGFSLDSAVENIRKTNSKAQIMKISAKTGEGVDSLVDFLIEKRTRVFNESINKG